MRGGSTTNRTLLASPSACDRLGRAECWLLARAPAEEILVVAASSLAAHELLRAAAAKRGAAFGWHRATLVRLEAEFAAAELAELASLRAYALPLLDALAELPARATWGEWLDALIALPVPRPYGDYGRIVNFRIEASFPDAVGAYVDWLVNESGWTIPAPDGSGESIALEARHVRLLFRRFKSFGNDVTRPYVRALEARRVPHVLVAGRSFHEREEVLAIRNALCAIEWPDDELRVFATLRGPLFALGDDALLAYRHRVARFHAQRRLLGATEEEAAAAAIAVSAALGHPLLARAAQAAGRSGWRRETPVLLRRPDGILAEGVVDLAFRESTDGGSAHWTVVDFKTDRELLAQRERYEGQVRTYVEAVEAATDEPATGVLLMV